MEQLHASNDYGVKQKPSVLVVLGAGFIFITAALAWGFISYDRANNALGGVQATGIVTSSEPNGTKKCTTIVEVIDDTRKSIAVPSEVCGFMLGQRTVVTYTISKDGVVSGTVGNRVSATVQAVFVVVSLPVIVICIFLRRNSKSNGRFGRLRS